MSWTAFPGKSSKWVILVALLALGLGVRLRQYAAAPSYWYDEAYVLLNVFDRPWVALLGPLGYDQAAPPMFLWSLRALYVWVGPSELSMRLPAFLASSLALLALVPLARRVVGSPGWLWAVALGAVSHHAMTHAIEVKPYANDLLLAELLLWSAAAYILRERPSGW